jgi:hypothetical protein
LYEHARASTTARVDVAEKSGIQNDPDFVIPTSRAAAMEESAVTGSIDAACDQQIPPFSLSLGVGMTKHEEALAA